MSLAKDEAIRAGASHHHSEAGARHSVRHCRMRMASVGPCGTAIQEFIVPPQPAVSKGGTVPSQDALTFNRYGLVVGGHDVLIYPAALQPPVTSPSHALLCFAVGSRVRTIRNAVLPALTHGRLSPKPAC